ncbi:hypothetical protein [Marinomonas flavescens]|uniref:hypothetical protein n=1 Tax=Marinomonas flavescens TaxID=2529379 RepID=UPI0010546933|nr:hypothetical protein [Marinomonas flavescens]
MDEVKLAIEKLINESPIDEATRHHDKSHILNLVKEDISDLSDSNILHTDKNYRTHRIEEAAIGSIKDKLGRWSNNRNDIVLKAIGIIKKQSNSDLDIKKRKLTEEMEGEKSKATDSYMRNNNYADLKANFEGTKRRYEDMRAELGGKPPITGRIWLYIIVIMMIGFIEWFVNYSTFSTKYPPGIAFGATVLVALSIALASHFHGGLLKQRLSLFARHRKKEEKRQVLIKQSFFSLLLIISLSIVTYNRYDILSANTIESGGVALAGMSESSESIIGVLIQFSLLNILVWIVGVAISYFVHDPRPDYQESLKHYETAKKKFHRADKGLQEEIERIEQEFEESLKNATNSLSSHQNDIRELETLLGRLSSKETALIKQALNSINNMLEKHHAILITELNAMHRSNIAIGPDALTIDQFKTKTITIDSNFIRQTLSLEAI